MSKVRTFRPVNRTFRPLEPKGAERPAPEVSGPECRPRIPNKSQQRSAIPRPLHGFKCIRYKMCNKKNKNVQVFLLRMMNIYTQTY